MIISIMAGFTFGVSFTSLWAALDWLAGSSGNTDYFTLFATTALASGWTAHFVNSQPKS